MWRDENCKRRKFRLSIHSSISEPYSWEQFTKNPLSNCISNHIPTKRVKNTKDKVPTYRGTILVEKINSSFSNSFAI